MDRLEKLLERGATFLGVKYPIMAGAMSWVSEHNLVAAISNAGGFGVLAGGAMPKDLLREEIRKVQAKTKNPFGVNLITLHPDLSNLVDVCLEENVSHIVLAGGLPPAFAIEKFRAANRKVLCFAPTLALAKKLIRQGVDALVLEGSEAGGHIGPVSLTVLAQEILPYIDEVPVFVAGGLGHGAAIAQYLAMGASGCQLGTRFACATESIAHPLFKKAFVRASARDAVSSVQLDPRFPVIPVRALKNQASQEFIDKQRWAIGQYESGAMSLQDAQMEIEHFWAGSLRRAVIDGDIENGSLMAGQSVGMVKEEQSVSDIIQELLTQARLALERAQ